jgi:predicted dehydrogenase
MNRREFLNKGAGSLMAASLGARTTRRPLSPDVVGANEKVVLALIGAGNRGQEVLLNTLRKASNVEVKTICDVNRTRADAPMGRAFELQGYWPNFVGDMREVYDDPDIDAVIVATPEHWHVLASVWAMQAGKDVFVEKNATLNIWEGQKLIEAARKYKRVVQIGTQNRSAECAWSARQYIAEGGLGKVVHVKSYNLLPGSRHKWEPQEDADIPKGLNWDAWLGPAEYVPYNPGRHSMNGRGGWGYFWAYSGGHLGDDASHVLDAARLVLGDPGHPKSVYHAGGNTAFLSERETPEMQCITYDYGDFTWTCESGGFTPYMRKTPPEVRVGELLPSWPQNSTRTEIYGTERMMYFGRHGGGWQVLERDGKEAAKAYGMFPDDAHQKNFIDCIRSRQDPNGVVEQGHMSACLVHLANIAYRVGNKHLVFDAETERFTNNEDANGLLRSSYREPYILPDDV